MRRCQGIKHCEYAAAEIVNQNHEFVDFDSEAYKNMVTQQDNNTVQSKTYS